jgi:hypothetical protein
MGMAEGTKRLVGPRTPGNRFDTDVVTVDKGSFATGSWEVGRAPKDGQGRIPYQ